MLDVSSILAKAHDCGIIFLDEVNMRYQIAILRIYDHSTTFGFIFLINGMINKQINHG